MYQEAQLLFSKQELARHGTAQPLSFCVISETEGGAVMIMSIFSPAYVLYLRPVKADVQLSNNTDHVSWLMVEGRRLL